MLGVAAPLLGGWLLMRAWGGTNVEALFLGTAMVATSVGITARVLSAMGLLDAPTARIILGAAVIDDILGLIVLAIVSGTAPERFDLVEIGTTAALAIGFTLFVAFVGAPVIKRAAPSVERAACGRLVLRLRAHPVSGAFGGGRLHRRGGHHRRVPRRDGARRADRRPTHDAQADERGDGVHGAVLPRQHRDATRPFGLPRPVGVLLSIVVTLVAVATKLVACGAGAWNLGVRRAAQVGMGMVPRGEVGIVVAQLGLSLAIISAQFYGVVLFMAVATTLIAPPFIKLLFAGEPAARGKVAEDDAGGILREGDHCRIG